MFRMKRDNRKYVSKYYVRNQYLLHYFLSTNTKKLQHLERGILNIN